MYRKIDYFYASIDDESGAAFRFLSKLAARGVDLTALTAFPIGPDKAQITLFPTEPQELARVASRKDLELDGPHSALLFEGDDQVGAFAGALAKLTTANVDVFSIQGMTDGRGGFRYLVFLKPSDIDRALEALDSP